MEWSQTDHVQRVTKNRKSPYLASVAACDYKYNAIKIDIKKLGAPSLSKSVVGSRRRKSVVVSFYLVNQRHWSTSSYHYRQRPLVNPV